MAYQTLTSISARVCGWIVLVQLIAPSLTRAEALVIQLDKTAVVGQARDGYPALSTVRSAPIPSGLPRRLRLPLAFGADGGATFSLKQESVDEGVEKGAVEPAMRLRILSPAAGRVSEDASGRLALGMDATLVFEELPTGKSRVFDISIRGDVAADVANDADFPIHVEAWRRSEDGKPLANPTKENRSFWGTLPGRFEP